MANLKDSPHFAVYDDYYTPKIGWEQIEKSIPKDKLVWEACLLGADLSKSDEYLREIGCQVIADRTMDCLTQQPDNWDLIITNIPFDIKKKVPILTRFFELDKPFIVIMNSMNTFTKYFHKLIQGKEKDIQIITPSGKINFDKLEGGVLTPTKNCSFYCVYVCYKLNLPSEELWLL
tara:strand:+ start:1111 stop:1638 length:528 start_codon:yes stop_codon:yes gene_type:complete